MPTVTPTIGLFGLAFNPAGKLLAKRRKSNESLPGDWDLPGGAAEVEAAVKALDERLIPEELSREFFEETGVKVSGLQAMPAMYAAVSQGGKDWAFAIMIGIVDIPEREDIRYVSLDELEELANGPVGNRLVSGPGKRMHRLCLRGMASRDSPSPDRVRAGLRLQQIQNEWK